VGRRNRRKEKITYRRPSWFILLAKYNSGDKNKEVDMSGACSTHGTEDMYTEFLLGNFRLRCEDNIKNGS